MKSVLEKGAKMSGKRLATVLNLTGCILIVVGICLLFYPTLSFNSAMGSALVIGGSFLQSKFKRYDIYGRTYGKWLEEKIQQVIPAETNSTTDLGGRRLFSTILNLLGIPILVFGFYLTTLPAFSFRYGLGDIFLMLGVILQVKYTAFIGSNSAKDAKIYPSS